MRDDPVQSPIAEAVLQHPSFVSDTVLLETAWLLSSRYRIGRADLAATLQDVVRLPAVRVSDPDMIDWAIERFAAGADFADMIHIIAGRHADGFVSFESQLQKQAGPDAPLSIEIPV